MTNHGEVRCYDDMHAILRRVAELRNISRETIDEIAGLPRGYASKVLAEVPLRRLGPDTLGAMMGAVGLKFLAVDDPDAIARYTARAASREVVTDVLTADRHKIIIIKTSKHRMRKLSKLAAKARREKIPAKRRKQIARRAAKMRWHKPKIKEILLPTAEGNEADLNASNGGKPEPHEQSNCQKVPAP